MCFDLEAFGANSVFRTELINDRHYFNLLKSIATPGGTGSLQAAKPECWTRATDTQWIISRPLKAARPVYRTLTKLVTITPARPEKPRGQ